MKKQIYRQLPHALRAITIAMALIAVGCFTTGCTYSAPKFSVVNPGVIQYPDQIRPLIFFNVRTESSLNYLVYGKTPLRLNGLVFQNLATGKFTKYTFDANLFLKGSKNVPFQADDHTNSVISPILITMEPGDYILNSVDIRSILPNVNVATLLLELPQPKLKFTIPDADFVSLGTLLVVLEGKKGATVGDILEGFKVESNDRHACLRTLSNTERDFAVKTYPFLKSLNLDAQGGQARSSAP